MRVVFECVCIHGSTWACGCTREQCVFLWHFHFGGPLPTCTSAPRPPHPEADGGSTLWHLVKALWGQAVCVEFTAFSLALPLSSLLWHAGNPIQEKLWVLHRG